MISSTISSSLLVMMSWREMVLSWFCKISTEGAEQSILEGEWAFWSSSYN
jgi:hypothetical protein